jgi:hypothetical protein
MEMVRNSNSGFFIILFILLVAFSSVTSNIISTATTPVVYAAKSKSKGHHISKVETSSLYSA